MDIQVPLVMNLSFDDAQTIMTRSAHYGDQVTISQELGLRQLYKNLSDNPARTEAQQDMLIELGFFIEKHLDPQ